MSVVYRIAFSIEEKPGVTGGGFNFICTSGASNPDVSSTLGPSGIALGLVCLAGSRVWEVLPGVCSAMLYILPKF